MTTAVGRNIASAGGTNWLKTSVVHDVDPKRDILDRIGVIPPDAVQFSKILVAVYVRPKLEKTAGGIILDTSRQEKEKEEDIYQGKVGLIVAMGKLAYEDDEDNKFHGIKNKVGDWVWFRPAEGWACEFNGVLCRLLSENKIIGRIPHPDMVW